MIETRQMIGPCGLTVVPANQVPAYIARGFELCGSESVDVIQQPARVASKKKSRQVLAPKTKLYGNHTRKNK